MEARAVKQGGRLAPRLFSCCLALSLALGGCGAREQRFQAQFLGPFDTVTTVVGYTKQKERFQEQVQFLHDELEQYHRLYDIYHDYEGVVNLKTLNDHAGQGPLSVDRRIIGLLRCAKEMEALTSGKVNVALGSVLSLWHGCREQALSDPLSARLPDDRALRGAAGHCDLSKVMIDEAAGTVAILDPGLRLDVGAIAKGYALREVCAQLEEQGADQLLISLGGNVCAIGGMDRMGTPFSVGLLDPQSGDEQRYLLTLGLQDCTVATSGDYQRYFTLDGVRYCHIIDPQTLYPARHCQSVSVLAGDPALCDALSTALFCLSPEEGLALIESLPDVEAFWLLPGGGRRQSSGFSAAVLEGESPLP